MKIAISFVAMALLLCAGASVAQQAPVGQPPAGLSEGMDPAIARRMAVPPPAPAEPLAIPSATNEWLTWG